MELLEQLHWRYATKKMDPTKTVPQEKVDRIKANAEKLLANAREELEASERNVAKAVKVRDERKARVEALEAQASASMTHGSNSYAVALGAESIDPVED